MRFDSLIPVLDVSDVEASIEFYSTVLGFSVQDKVQWGGKTEWALLRTGKVQLMLCACKECDGEDVAQGSDGVFFVYLDNIEALHTYLAACGYDPKPHASQPSGKRQDFYLRDPDGYVLWFSHRVMADGQTSQASDEQMIIMQQQMART